MEAKLIKEAGGYDLYRIDEDGKRVTFASTQDYKQKLSHKNCQAIELGYDLDELADECSIDWNGEVMDGSCGIYKEGFQKALEILGDKKFSSGQLLNAMDLVWQWMNGEDYGCKTLTEVQDKHIQSLQQTEWDVWLVMACGLPDGCTEPEVTCTCDIIPSLDADGCIILKRK